MPTRIRGGQVITLRGGGSRGNDAQKVGAGTEVGLDIQVPAAQTAAPFTITKPDGTVLYSITAAGQVGVGTQLAIVNISANGAIAPRPSINYSINKAGVTALTLVAPTFGTDDGVMLRVTSVTAFAHTITSTGNFSPGSAATDVATFAAFAGASLTLLALEGKWRVLSANGVSFT